MTGSTSDLQARLTVERLGEAGAGIFHVRTSLAEAKVSLFGGQILAWKPAHIAQPVLWLSPLAALDGTKAIRGGIPICWPWFGAHPASKSLPAHGLARLDRWRVDGFSLLSDGDCELVLTLPAAAVSTDASEADIGGGLRLTQAVRIGESLSVSLTTRNDGDTERRYSEGLHTYFHVHDVEDVRVEGLDGGTYDDLTAGNVRRAQSGSIAFDGETARLFVGTEHACEIVDRGFGRRIRVEKTGSRSTAVWNPGGDVASRMPDLGPTAWRQMVCVETANAMDDSILIAPGEFRTMTARYSVEPLD